MRVGGPQECLCSRALAQVGQRVDLPVLGLALTASDRRKVVTVDRGRTGGDGTRRPLRRVAFVPRDAVFRSDGGSNHFKQVESRRNLETGLQLGVEAVSPRFAALHRFTSSKSRSASFAAWFRELKWCSKPSGSALRMLQLDRLKSGARGRYLPATLWAHGMVGRPIRIGLKQAQHERANA